MSRLTEKLALEELERISQMDTIFLQATDVAPLLESDPQYVRDHAKSGRLDIPAIINGNQVKIPRLEFIEWYRRRFLAA